MRRAGREHGSACEARRHRDPRAAARVRGRAVMDLTSRLRSIVRPPGSRRELRYEPDTGRYEATIDVDRVAEVLGGRPLTTAFGRAVVVDRRYESDRFHGDVRIG